MHLPVELFHAVLRFLDLLEQFGFFLGFVHHFKPPISFGQLIMGRAVKRISANRRFQIFSCLIGLAHKQKQFAKAQVCPRA